MKAVKRCVVWLAKWLLRMQGQDVDGNVGALVKELVSARAALEQHKIQMDRLNVALAQRQVEVRLTARVPSRDERAKLLRILAQYPEASALLDELDELWVRSVNDITLPGTDDRARQWLAGRSETLMELKKVLQS